MDTRIKYYDKEKECSSVEERKERQFKIFLSDLEFAYNNCEYYKNLFGTDFNISEYKSYDDIVNIPKTKKSEIVNIHKSNPPFGGMLVNGAKLNRIYVSPGPIYDPEGDSDDYWNMREVFTNVGFLPGDRVVNTFSYHLTPAGIFCDEALKNIGCTMIPTGVGNTEIQIQTMKNLQVTGYVGTPSFLHMLIKKAESMGYDWNKEFNLKIACVAGEMLPNSLRKEFEEKYHIIVRQFFATADMGGIGYECNYKSGIHFSENRLVEIVNPETGKHCAPGEPGELVVSTLGNRTYPLIRLGTGDLIVHAEEECGCGRTSFRIEKIVGRVDMVTKVRGMFIHPGQVNELVNKFEYIKKGKIVVIRENDYDRMIFYAELTKDIPLTETYKDKIISAIRDIFKLKGEVKFVESGVIKDSDKLIDDQRKWD
jgi:phenylacetate-CoA ligase